jgi:hypothetical protein
MLEEQGEFKSAFDQFFTPSENTKSDEREADAFDDEDGYEDEGLQEPVAADDFDDFDDDEPEVSEGGDDSFKKRYEDSQKYISELQSKLDSQAHQFNQIQQQLNYLLSNQNQNQQAEDDFSDLVSYDPEEYGTQEEFQQKESKRKKLEELRLKAQQGEQVVMHFQNLQQQREGFARSQSDYNEILDYAKKVKENTDPKVQQVLQQVVGDEAMTYLYLKYLREQDRITSYKKRLKKRSKGVPPTDFRRSSGPKSSNKGDGGFADILMQNAANNMQKLQSFDLKK